MKIALIADIHFGVRQDSKFFLDKQTDFFSNKFFPYLKDNDINTVICLGDLMDRRKYINYKTLYTVKEHFIEPLVNNNIDAHFIVGNHDIFLKTSLDYNAYDALFAHTGIPIYREIEDVTIGGFKFLFVPWVTSENIDTISHKLAYSDAKVCCGHFEVSGVSMMRGIVNQAGIPLSTFNNFDYTFSGHFHLPSENGRLIMVGSPLQYTWNDYGDKKRIVIFDTVTETYESVQFEDELFVKINYDDLDATPQFPDEAKRHGLFIKLNVINKTDLFLFNNFCEKIQSYDPSRFDIIESQLYVSADVDNLEDKSTIDVIVEYIDNLENSEVYNMKSDLKVLISELYTEAIARRTI